MQLHIHEIKSEAILYGTWWHEATGARLLACCQAGRKSLREAAVQSLVQLELYSGVRTCGIRR